MRTSAPEKGSKTALIAHWLRERLKSGVYGKSQRLESENELAARFEVTRLTARQAIMRLEQEGLVTRIQGKGTFPYQEPSLFHSPKHKRIAFVTRDLKGHVFTYTLEGAKEACSQSGYELELYSTADDTRGQRSVLESLTEAPIDGLIIEAFKTALPSPNEDIFRKLVQKGIPCVFLNGFHQGIGGISYVVANDREATAAMVDHLHSLGHEKIGGIFNAMEYAGHERYRGYLEGMQRNGLAVEDRRIMFIAYNEVQYVFDNLFNAYRSGILECTAMVCFSDHFARHLEATLNRCGLVMPRDMSITGVDDLNYPFGSNTRLTTAAHPKEEMGRQAVQIMLKMLETGKLAEGRVLHMPIIIGNSTTIPRNGPIDTLSHYIHF